MAAPVSAQQAAEPADEGLPEVQVIQKKTPGAKKKAAPVAKKQAPPATSPEPLPPPEIVEEQPADPNSVYGSPASAGAQSRATQSAQTPVNPTQLIPTDLTGFSSAATNLTPDILEERQPRTVNEAFTRVPGVVVINDDGNAHHGGVSVRGSPPRRSRKMLVMEDGHTVNMALWLDPSVHYWAPIERMESIEVIRGTVITHGPNNNFGVLNSRNLSPFGPEETVISSAIGFTKNKTGSYVPLEIDAEDGEVEEDGEPRRGGNDTDTSVRYHVHTRQHAGNVGLVASYTGANIQGNWDQERLRVDDFYGALGWKGADQDLTVSVIHARQKDDYDEQNFLGNYEFEVEADSAEEAEEQAEAVFNRFAGLAEQQFNQLKHCKTCFAPASVLNTYTGEIWRGQVVHNAYLDDDTTITSRFYAGYHRRDRYQLVSPTASPSGVPSPNPEDDDPELEIDDDGEGELIFGEDSMFGRLRAYRHVGGEVRGEWANRQLFGFKQDLQAGVRYEWQDMTNQNIMGDNNQILKDGDDEGAVFFDRALQANAVSAFLQTNIYAARDFNVVPGVRFEWFEAKRHNRVIAQEEGESGEADDCPVASADECLEIEDLLFVNSRESFDSFNALPGVAFAYTGFNRTTVFGGYHRGLTTTVLRNEDFPAPDEIGDNFNLGFRSQAIKGVDLEVVGFYHLMHDLQFGESFSALAGDREFGRAEEAEISGVELFGRVNSQPFTGGSYNFFAEGNYTYARSVLTDAPTFDGDGNLTGNNNGNRIPEVPFHVAALTFGVEQRTGWRWDASATWTYRGSFFTDAANTPYGFGAELECEPEDGDPGEYECEIEEAGESGEVPDVWLLSARFNMDIGETGASVWVAGDNLLDEFYIADREDGMKPGIGRTVWAGFKYKF